MKHTSTDIKKIVKADLVTIDSKLDIELAYTILNEYVTHVPRETKVGALSYLYRNNNAAYNEMIRNIETLQ